MAKYYTAQYAFQTSILSGWGGQFNPSSLLSSFHYDVSGTILYTVYPQNQYDVYLNVPISIAQQLTLSGRQYNSNPNFPNPDTIYSTNISGVYPKCILTENGQPLLCDNGDYLTTLFGKEPANVLAFDETWDSGELWDSGQGVWLA